MNIDPCIAANVKYCMLTGRLSEYYITNIQEADKNVNVNVKNKEL